MSLSDEILLQKVMDAKRGTDTGVGDIDSNVHMQAMLNDYLSITKPRNCDLDRTILLRKIEAEAASSAAGKSYTLDELTYVRRIVAGATGAAMPTYTGMLDPSVYMQQLLDAL